MSHFAESDNANKRERINFKPQVKQTFQIIDHLTTISHSPQPLYKIIPPKNKLTQKNTGRDSTQHTS